MTAAPASTICASCEATGENRVMSTSGTRFGASTSVAGSDTKNTVLICVVDVANGR